LAQQPLGPLGRRDRTKCDKIHSHTTKPPGLIYAREVNFVKESAAKPSPQQKAGIGSNQIEEQIVHIQCDQASQQLQKFQQHDDEQSEQKEMENMLQF
jgi:hypothetical protein